LEYAILLGEYQITQSLLVGGINLTGGKVEPSLATRITRQVMLEGIPISLSIFLVKRVVDMRLEGHYRQTMTNTLCFGEPCYHAFDKPTFWEFILTKGYWDQVGWDDTVSKCPVCGIPSTDNTEWSTSSRSSHPNNASITPAERHQLSFERYQSLPATSADLKLLPKKQKASKLDALSQTWKEAIQKSIGNSQTV
jgi:hypothetical protein